MRPRITLALALTAWGVNGCATDRIASTEVENELVGVVVGTAEDTASLVAARWLLADSASTLFSGTTDSLGSIVATRVPVDRDLELLVLSQAETLRIAIPAGSLLPGDTLRLGVNLLTDAVSRAWEYKGRKGSLPVFGDSLARDILGLPFSWPELSAPRGRRSQDVTTILQTLNLQVRRGAEPPWKHLDALASDPSRNLVRDSAFGLDLAQTLRNQGLARDSQRLVVRRLDSLSGEQGRLFDAWDNAIQAGDSLLLVELLPWLGQPEVGWFLRYLKDRATSTGQVVLMQPRPAMPMDLVTETARRLSMRMAVRALQDLSSPPLDGMVLARLLDEADSTARETFQFLRIEQWFGRDRELDELLEPIVLLERSPAWSTTAYVEALDPAAMLAVGWIFPHGEPLRKALEKRVGDLGLDLRQYLVWNDPGKVPGL
ncbi:MAG: hypothetical protein H6686_09985 [Fibrobacteria bacterium]|nr:hypothetical protein [Fibrobacteria bacterium]